MRLVIELSEDAVINATKHISKRTDNMRMSAAKRRKLIAKAIIREACSVDFFERTIGRLSNTELVDAIKPTAVKIQ